jgi:hypothetical protein
VSELVAASGDFVESSFHSRDSAMRTTFVLAIADRRHDCVGRMHASHMLYEEIFTVEVVGSIGRFLTLIAAPEAEAEVLRQSVSFPFVFGVES